jgi:hypothetical protein
MDQRALLDGFANVNDYKFWLNCVLRIFARGSSGENAVQSNVRVRAWCIGEKT